MGIGQSHLDGSLKFAVINSPVRRPLYLVCHAMMEGSSSEVANEDMAANCKSVARDLLWPPEGDWRVPNNLPHLSKAVK